MTHSSLDDPRRGGELRAIIQRKPALRAWYEDVYRRYASCMARSPREGVALEIGSGGGFAKEIVPQLTTSDVLAYDGIDVVADAMRMPFRDGSLRFIGMLNVFHHIPDAGAFLGEAQRCLMPGGRMLIVDQHRGIFSEPILRFAHHEPYRPQSREWKFESDGPLSGANGALAWIVFERDRERLGREYPALELLRLTPHSPLHYWLAGGLKSWSLLGENTFAAASAMDRALTRISPRFGSFVDIELRRR